MGTITRSFDNQITSSGVNAIADDTIVNADINASAGLVLTKLASTGTLTVDNIQFPATAVPSADANNLDDYEEGTYTITTNANLTANSGYATFQYTKIGRQVTVNGGLVVSAVSSTNDVTISLPFTSKGNPANGQSVGSGAVYPIGGVATGDAGLVIYLGSSASVMSFGKVSNNVNTASLKNSDLAVSDELLVTVTYFI
jgi:hypothetical protein